MKATPQPVVSSRYLFLRSWPKMVLCRKPASRATFTNATLSGRPAINWSNEKTGSEAQRERMNDRRDRIERTAVILSDGVGAGMRRREGTEIWGRRIGIVASTGVAATIPKNYIFDLLASASVAGFLVFFDFFVFFVVSVFLSVEAVLS